MNVGGGIEGDAYGTVGENVGLDPQGDGFLSVRNGPGGKPILEVDRLYSGNIVSLCEARGL